MKPRLVHNRPIPGSEAASFSETHSDDDESAYSLPRPYNAFHRENERRILDADLYAGPSSAPSLCDRDSVYSTDSDSAYSLTDENDQSFYMNADNWPRPARGTYALPKSPYVLPETVKVSPLSASLPVERDSPVSAIILSEIQHEQPVSIGWGYVKDSREDLGNIGIGNVEYMQTPSTAGTVFPKAEFTISPRSTKKSKKEKRTPSPGPAHAGNVMTGMYAGSTAPKSPKGEGQKLWKSIQNFRKQDKAIKRVQAQDLQLRTIYEKAFGKGGETPAFIPPRPDPPSPLGISRSVSVERSISRSPSPLAIPRPPPMGIKHPPNPSSQRDSASTNSSKTSHVLRTSRSMPYNRTPCLDPAPRSRMEVKNFGNGKRGLPPPPVPPSPSPKKAFGLGIGATTMASRSIEVMNEKDWEMQNRNFKRGLPPPPVPPSPSVNVGLGLSFPPPPVKPRSTSGPAAQTKMQYFSALDDRITERPRNQHKAKASKKKPSWFARLCNVDDQVSVQHPARPVANVSSTKQDRPKPHISHPQPMLAPNGGRTANISAASGGVGGPASALSLSRREMQENEERRRRRNMDGKKQGRTPTPQLNSSSRTPAPVGEALKGRPGVRHSTSKFSQNHSFWQDMFSPSHPEMESGKGKGKETLWSGRKRNDSDTSFGCKGLSSSPQSEYPPLNPYRESHMQSVGYTRSRSGAATCRNPGPSGQNRRVVDGGSTGLVPSPLFSAGRRGKSLERKPSQVRNTIFYQPYDEVLNEYRK